MWNILILAAVLGLLAVLASLVLQRSRSASESQDMRAFQRLAIAVQGFELWPEVARQLGRGKLPVDKASKVPPYIDKISQAQYPPLELRHFIGKGKKEDCAKIGSPTEGRSFEYRDAQLIINESGMSVRGPSISFNDDVLGSAAFSAMGNRRLCYEIGPIRYERALPVPDGFLSMLLFSRDKGRSEFGDNKVIAQIGPDHLPIISLRDIPEFNKLKVVSSNWQQPAKMGGSTDAVAASIVVAGGKLDSGGRTLEPISATIAGKRYRLYGYPVNFGGQEMFLIGVTRPPPLLLLDKINDAQLVAVSLILVGLLALTPILRMASIGPVDGIKRYEIVMAAAGLMLCTAIATTLVILWNDTNNSRKLANSTILDSSKSLAKDIKADLVGNLRNAGMFVNSDSSTKKTHATMLFLDNNGDPPNYKDKNGIFKVIPFVSRSNEILSYSSKNVYVFNELSSRKYYTRIMDGNLIPETGRYAELITGGLRGRGVIPDCNDININCNYAIDQIISYGDGLNKTVVTIPVTGCFDKNNEFCKASVKLAGFEFVMESVLSPELKPSLQFAVIDLSQPSTLPTIFHSERSRAHAERFALSISPVTRRRLDEALNWQSPSCSADDADPTGILFSGSYIGERQTFAVSRVPCTDWAVVVFQPTGFLAQFTAVPAELALTIWIGLILMLGLLLCALGLGAQLLVHFRMGMLWPDARLRRQYFWIATLCVVVCVLSWSMLQWKFHVGYLLAVIGLSLIAGLSYLIRAANKVAQLGSSGGTRNRTTEFTYGAMLAMLLVVSTSLPIYALSRDAFDYQADVWARDVKQNKLRTDQERKVQIYSVKKSQMGDNAGFLDTGAILPARDIPEEQYGPNIPLTARLFCLLGREKCNAAEPTQLGKAEEVAAKAAREHKGPKAAAAASNAEDTGWLTMDVFFKILVFLAAAALPIVALLVLCRDLFGFGIPLETIRYPKIRSGPDLGFANSDFAPDSPIWAARYPGSTHLKQDKMEEKLIGLSEAGLGSTDNGREVLRIHLDDWGAPGANDELANWIARFRSLQEELKVEERARLKAWSQLDREPRESHVFRLLVISGTPLTALQVASKLRDALASFRDEDAPPYAEEHAPERAVLVAGSDDLRQRMREYAGKHIIDLYETRTLEEVYKADVVPLDCAVGLPRPLLIVENLDLLMRDKDGRGQALKLLERLVQLQDQRRGNRASAQRVHFRLLLITDISPLDRFLQAAEMREAEDEAGLPTNADDPSGNVRWSRLLEDFTTYTGRAEPRPHAPPDEPDDPAHRPGVRYVLRELAYLPDHVVEALLPDHDGVLLECEIKEWAGFLGNAGKPAIADFLASQLIEHYHYVWSISSRAEQILIHRMAGGEIPNIRVAYALRSLVRRGIVVFDPWPRLMNDSFMRFVRNVERPDLLRIWMRSAPQGLWTRINGQFTVVLPIVVLLGITLVASGTFAAQAMIPVIAASVPALLTSLFAGRRASVATGA